MMWAYGDINGSKLPNGFYEKASEIINREINNENYYYEDILRSELQQINPEWIKALDDIIYQPTKPVYMENILDTTLGIEKRVYIKSSDYPLTPNETKGFEIDKLRIQMEKNGISRLSFKSAVKVGSPNKNNVASIFKEDGTINDNINWTNSVLTLPRSGFGYQQDVPYNELKAAISRVSQASKNLFNNITYFIK
jgi:hypothetical protein